jgi:hypothetical protein
VTASVKVGELLATVEVGEWACEADPHFAEACKLFADLARDTLAYYPDPDFSDATAAAEALGGTVVDHVPLEYVPGRIY